METTELENRLIGYDKTKTDTWNFGSLLCCGRWHYLVFPPLLILFNTLGNSRNNSMETE
jgi:hypothetical protein